MGYTYITLHKQLFLNGTASDSYFAELKLESFPTWDEAFMRAEKLSEDELVDLSEMDKNNLKVSYGIPKDEEYKEKHRIRVNYYNITDDTVITLTERIVVPIEN